MAMAPKALVLNKIIPEHICFISTSYYLLFCLIYPYPLQNLVLTGINILAYFKNMIFSLHLNMKALQNLADQFIHNIFYEYSLGYYHNVHHLGQSNQFQVVFEAHSSS